MLGLILAAITSAELVMHYLDMEIIKLFSCPTLINMKFVQVINSKILLSIFEQENCLFHLHFDIQKDYKGSVTV